MRVPIHRVTCYLPNGTEHHSDSYPTCKLEIEGHCKYCYRDHADWWQMKFDDYGEDVVLCEHCGHTSEKENMER